MHGDADDAAIPLEDGLHIVFGEREGVEVSAEHPRVDHLRVIGVGDVTDLTHTLVHPHESENIRIGLELVF